MSEAVSSENGDLPQLMNDITLDDILAIRAEIDATNINSCEIRTLHALMSAIEAPRRSAFGVEVYPTLAEKAGALVYGLIQNHPFWDGNKRIAAAALRLFLARNGADLQVDDGEFERFTRAIALGDVRTEAIARWVDDHLVILR